jgi:hypothetical protein
VLNKEGIPLNSPRRGFFFFFKFSKVQDAQIEMRGLRKKGGCTLGEDFGGY